MTRAISRDSFNELKQYLGVHLQQGRVILDSDWNEAQDIMATLARRLGQDEFGDGVLGEGFEIQPVMPSPWRPISQDLFEISYFQGHLPTSLRFPPTAPFDAFESMDGWALTGTGKLRSSRDRPYEGRSFMRLSDHTGQVTMTRTLPAPVDLSQFQFGHFRFRLNQSVPSGAASFFVEDATGARNVWPLTAPWIGKDRWAPGAVLPLDLNFNLFDIDLLPAINGQPYTSLIPALNTTASLTWSVTAGALPTGLSLTTATSAPNLFYGRITGTPTALGPFTFTASASAGGTTIASRSFSGRVQAAPTLGQLLDLSTTADRLITFWNKIKARPTKPSGTAANLSNITKYGFLITAQGAAPAIWDFDALYFSSRNLVQGVAANNFVISGPLLKQALDVELNSFQAQDALETGGDPVQILAALPQVLNGTPRAYVGGLACTQPREVLYSDQADPSDPVLTTPTGLRKDLVYLDVWREPATYIEDPELREIALGGPDTSTRVRLRQRVRVAQGGTLPTDNTGGGTLATEGSYTDSANRLYLVEVDTAGDIGTATVRWSEDNASTIQRVIEAIPPNSTKVKVEDASAFRPGDFILIRKELKDEEHRIASILGNTITLQEATGGSTTFALADRPKVQRWNGFHAPIVADTNDPTMSAAISLSFGVKIRIGGRALRKGDFWTFRTRFLAGDTASGIDPTARIETLDFQLPQGTVHQYLPLALIIRDPASQFPDRVQLIRDQRSRAGRTVHYHQSFPSLSLSGTTTVHGDFLMLGLTSPRSSFMLVWSGTAQADAAGRVLQITVDLFNNDMTNPNADTGIVGIGASTTLVCDTSLVSRSAILAIDRVDLGIVAARTSFQLVSAGSVTLSGRLDVFEVKNQLRDIATFEFDL
jgi:Putative Ig domain